MHLRSVVLHIFTCCLAAVLLVLPLGVWAQEQQLSDQSVQTSFELKRIFIAGELEPRDPRIGFEKLNTLAAEHLSRLEGRVNIDQLNAIADALTLYVRGHGYIFHSVFLPPQRMRHGLLKFEYKEAVLSDINIINHSTTINGAYLQRALKSLVGKELYAPDIESSIQFLQALPGISVFAFYSRAEAEEKIRLNLRIEDKDRHQFSLQLDNYGNRASGETRLVPSYRGNSLLRNFDRLTIALMATAGEGGALHGYFNYSLPFGDLHNYIRLGGGDTSYELGSNFTALEMSGSSRSYRATLGRQLAHSKNYFSDLKLGYTLKQSHLDSRFDASLENEEQSSYSELNLLNRLHSSHWLAELNLGLANGTYESIQISRQYGSETERDLQRASYAVQLRYQSSPSQMIGLSALIYARGQYTEARLPGIDQSSLGGVYAVRAISPGRYSADVADIISAELGLPLRLGGWYIKPYIFWDQAQGKTYEPQLNNKQTIVRLAGSGAGLQLAWNKLSLNLAAAAPVLEEQQFGADVEAYDGESQILFEARWN